MSQPKITTKDLANAHEYAANLYVMQKIDTYFNEKGIKLVKKNSKWSDNLTKYLKPNYKLEEKIEYSFNKESCKSIACFPFKGNDRCNIFENITFNDGTNTYDCCQKACSDFKNSVDTIWDNGKCKFLNSALKTYCLIPSQRSETKSMFNKVPPFKWLSDTNECKPSLSYCTHFSMSIDEKGDCYEQGFVKVFKFVFGQTITRQFTNNIFYPEEIYRPDWDGEVENKVMLNESLKNEKKDFSLLTRISNTENRDDRTVGEISLEIIKKLSIAILELAGIHYATKITIEILSRVMTTLSNIAYERLLPESIYQGCAAIATAFETIVTEGLVATFLSGSISLASTVLEITNPILYVLLAINLVSIIVDTIDPLHIMNDLKHYISKSNLKKINDILNLNYAKLIGGKNKFDGLIEITPLILWNLNYIPKDDEIDRMKFITIKAADYLNALKYNSLGQELDFKEEKKINKINITNSIIENNVREIFVFSSPSHAIKGFLFFSTFLFLFFIYKYNKTYKMIFLILILFTSFIPIIIILHWWSNNKSMTGNILYNY